MAIPKEITNVKWTFPSEKQKQYDDSIQVIKKFIKKLASDTDFWFTGIRTPKKLQEKANKAFETFTKNTKKQKECISKICNYYADEPQFKSYEDNYNNVINPFKIKIIKNLEKAKLNYDELIPALSLTKLTDAEQEKIETTVNNIVNLRINDIDELENAITKTDTYKKHKFHPNIIKAIYLLSRKISLQCNEIYNSSQFENDSKNFMFGKSMLGQKTINAKTYVTFNDKELYPVGLLQDNQFDELISSIPKLEKQYNAIKPEIAKLRKDYKKPSPFMTNKKKQNYHISFEEFDFLQSNMSYVFSATDNLCLLINEFCKQQKTLETCNFTDNFKEFYLKYKEYFNDTENALKQSERSFTNRIIDEQGRLSAAIDAYEKSSNFYKFLKIKDKELQLSTVKKLKSQNLNEFAKNKDAIDAAYAVKRTYENIQTTINEIHTKLTYASDQIDKIKTCQKKIEELSTATKNILKITAALLTGTIIRSVAAL